MVRLINILIKNSNQQKYYDDKITKQNYDIDKWRTQYTTFSTRIEEENAAKKEVEKRRRVSPKDKEAIFKRDNKTCQICGISYDFVEDLCEGLGDYLLLEIDHIQSVSQGGTGAEEENLQSLCWRCNRKKGGKKTNEDVKDSITYGVSYLKPKYKTKIKLNIEK